MMKPQQENDNELFQNSIKYLHSISNIAALDIPALKSFYSTKGRLMELRKGICLSTNIARLSVRCQRCCVNLLHGPASYRIKPAEKKSKFARRLLAKSQHNKPFTKYQREYLKKLNTFNGNQLAIICKFCKKESLIKVQKPKKLIHLKVSKTTNQKKKKIKKKDKYCGLNQEVVMSLTPQNIKNLPTPNDANGNKQITKKENFASQDPVLSLTPQNVRDLDNSDYIPLSTTHKKTFKLSRKENLTAITLKVDKQNIKEDKYKLKKRSKNLYKLSEFLNTPDKPKASPSSSLKQFLQSL